MFSSFARELIEDPAGNELLVALSKCTEETVPMSASLKAIHSDHNVVECIIGSDIIFTRDFYANLLVDIRLLRKCILIGNPGIGKSYFQLYYLARIMNPSVFGPLPSDSNGCTDAPRVVIRQEGSEMTIYDIENRVAYECDANKLLLKCFDPKVTLYLYEPGNLKTEPYFDGLRLPILATVSPDSSRYKEFSKNKATKLYMPTYTCDELLAAGDYLLKRGRVTDDMTELYSPDEIKKRYNDFGGIIRHALPDSVTILGDIYKKSELAVGNCDAKGIISNLNTIEDEMVSSFVMAMVVQRSGLERFRNFNTTFVSDNIRIKIEEKVMSVSLADRITVLLKNDQSGVYDKQSQNLYEGVLATLFTTPPGVIWTQRIALADELVEFKVKLQSIQRGSCPKFKDMVWGVLYWPSQDNFPAVEFFYKSEEGNLMAFQVTRQKNKEKIVKVSAYEKFLMEVGLEDSTKVILHLVHIPAMALFSSIKFVPDSYKLKPECRVIQVSKDCKPVHG